MLSIVTIGVNLFSFVGEDGRYTFNSWGITKYSLEGDKVIDTQTFPIFVGTIALVLLSFLCIMAYKNLNRQFKLGRTIFFIYFLSVVSMVLLAAYGDSFIEEEATKREMGLGFYLFICGLPFSFLANIGIKRDKRLLDSLDRLR
jgi:hypothetical protein